MNFSGTLDILKVCLRDVVCMKRREEELAIRQLCTYVTFLLTMFSRENGPRRRTNDGAKVAVRYRCESPTPCSPNGSLSPQKRNGSRRVARSSTVAIAGCEYVHIPVASPRNYLKSPTHLTIVDGATVARSLYCLGRLS